MKVWAQSKYRAADHLAKGAVWFDTPKNLASETDIVVLCVTNVATVKAILLGPEGISTGDASGKILIDHSTIRPEGKRDFACHLLNDSGIRWIDAPVSDGPNETQRGELIVKAGGDHDAFN